MNGDRPLLIAIVLDPAFLDQHGERLSRDYRGHVKFNVTRTRRIVRPDPGTGPHQLRVDGDRIGRFPGAWQRRMVQRNGLEFSLPTSRALVDLVLTR